jgi:hypothetical protein
MGLLDDAIREHLELKRLRGADPAEVARLEREALGPTRRGMAPAIAEDDAFEDMRPYDEEFGEDDQDAFDRLLGEESTVQPQAADPPADPYMEPSPLVDHPAPEADSGGEHAPPADLHSEPGAAHPPDGLDMTREWDVDSALDVEQSSPAPAPAPPLGPESPHGDQPEGEHADDLLEETPEFLQETPEHERLWFEQRPPRDFDFDG